MFSIICRLFATTKSKPQQSFLTNAHDLPKFKALLKGEPEPKGFFRFERPLTRDEALTWVGHIFGPEYSRDIINWYFGGFEPDQPFNREALLNHVECHIDAMSDTAQGE